VLGNFYSSLLKELIFQIAEFPNSEICKCLERHNDYGDLETDIFNDEAINDITNLILNAIQI